MYFSLLQVIKEPPPPPPPEPVSHLSHEPVAIFALFLFYSNICVRIQDYCNISYFCS